MLTPPARATRRSWRTTASSLGPELPRSHGYGALATRDRAQVPSRPRGVIESLTSPFCGTTGSRPARGPFASSCHITAAPLRVDRGRPRRVVGRGDERYSERRERPKGGCARPVRRVCGAGRRSSSPGDDSEAVYRGGAAHRLATAEPPRADIHPAGVCRRSADRSTPLHRPEERCLPRR
jgi:hypothetical protein